MTRSLSRKGFTLIELLVVIAIVAILLGLLLPAVQKVRESAQRTWCQNNMKQTGIALHAYHDTNTTLPAGAATSSPQLYWSWMALILPFIEQGALYNQALTWATTGPGSATPLSPWGDFANNPPTTPPNPALGTLVTNWACPADNRVLQPGIVTVSFVKTPIAFTSYLAVSSGTSSDKVAQAYTGSFYLKFDGRNYNGSSAIRLTDITDGTSSTILVGERPPSRDLAFGWWFAGAGWDGTSTGDVLLGAREVNYATFLGCPTSSVGLQAGDILNPCHQAHFWSFHSGGANFLFGDGSVHFLPYSANAILPALATRSGEEIINAGGLF